MTSSSRMTAASSARPRTTSSGESDVRAGFLGTKVGRRLLTLFLVAAMVPVCAMAIVGYAYVRDELTLNARERVAREAKSAGLSTLSSLERVNDLLRVSGRRGVTPVQTDDDEPEAAHPLQNLAVRQMAAGVPRVTNEPVRWRALSVAEAEHLQSGRTLLVVVPDSLEGHVLLARAIDPGEPSAGVLWGQIGRSHLWSATDEQASGGSGSLCIRERGSQTLIHCSGEVLPAHEPGSRGASDGGRAPGTDARLAATSDIFLRFEYGAPEWEVTVSTPSAIVLAPLARFSRTFALIALVTLIGAFLLSHVQIRRSTMPLVELRDGTRRVAAGDFQTLLEVRTDDEYAELATSFNGMARTLDRQITVLRSMDEIDQAVLASRQMHPLVEAAVWRFSGTVTCSRVTLALPRGMPGHDFDVVTVDPTARVRRETVALTTQAEREELRLHPRHFVLAGENTRRSYLMRDRTERLETGVLVLPLIHEREVLGLVALGFPSVPSDDSEDALEARRLADRVALAIANVRLVERLDALGVGTLTAFARAIDANSHWTSGHSERVTHTSLEIGKRMGLGSAELDALRRGGLMHDIGKIGIPPAILDKPSKLTDVEWTLMRRHPTLGAQILAPIPPFADAIPIVLHHHERMDGAGYPDGLRGEGIPLLARVLSVADVFDALVSERPYRAGLPVTDAMTIILDSAGTQFDPQVVAAFVQADREGAIGPARTSTTQAELANALELGRSYLGVAT